MTVALPQTTMPRVRVGLSVSAATLEVGGGAALRVTQPDGSLVGRIPAGVRATVTLADRGIAIRPSAAGLPILDALTLSPEDTGYVRINGRDYRGVVDLVRLTGGLLASNLVTVEEYVAGVVNAEMGRRAPEELEALRAQAVLSRTVAVRAIGRAAERGYDLLATVADQAYLGVGSELDQGRKAVADTRGIVLLWEGRVIDAFYHSTCGGRTAEPTEIFPGAGGRPYLRSVNDQSPTGASWCAISPRYRWREEWSGTEMAASLREGTPTTLTGRVSAGGMSRIRDVVITARGSTGRVQAITIYHGSGATPVEGANLVRQVLRPVTGGMLRSSHFTLQTTQGGEQLARLVAEGQGAGHGVGMCQWGAVGRARAGHGWEAILAGYFPGTVPGRLY
jgi:stage II sporulation protein D